MPTQSTPPKSRASPATARAATPAAAAVKRARGRTPQAAPTPWHSEVPSRTELRDRKSDALYRQAAIAFHEKGYAGTSLADIAARLGVSKGALYYYIDNKQQLLLACHLAASDAADAVIDLVPRSGISGADKLRIALRIHVESILGENSASMLALEESALTPENFRVVVARRDRFQGAFTRFVREGIADGSVVRCDPKLATFALLGGVNWVEKWYRPGGPWSATQIAQAMADMLVRGITADPAAGLAAQVSDYPAAEQALPPPIAPRADRGQVPRRRGAADVAGPGTRKRPTR